MTQDTARIFLALWPDRETRDALAALTSSLAWPSGARVTTANDLHVTLHFLGAFPRELLQDLAPALYAPCPSIDMQMPCAALWKAGLTVLMPTVIPEALTALHADLSTRFVDAGFTPDARPFRPHVTLARKAQGLELPQGDFTLRWRSHGYSLAESDHGYRRLFIYTA